MGKGEGSKTQRPRSCVLILGMHHSGISALAGVFGKLGCDLPAAPMPGSTASGTDFLEPSAIPDFNDELLSSAESSWDDFTQFYADWMSSPVTGEFLDRAVALLEAEFGQSRLFVLNDPRISRIIPFWLEALNRFGCAVKPVIFVRNPLEASHSLLVAEKFNEPLGQMLWLRHALDAEQSTRGLPRLVTSFDQLMEGWEAVARKAGQSLQLVWPKPAVNVELEIEALLSAIRTERADAPTRALANRLLPDWLRQTFEILNGWAEAAESAADYAKLDRLKTEFDTASNAFARVVRAERNAAAMNPQQGKGQREALRSRQPAMSAKAEDEISNLKRLLQEQRRQATLMQAEVHQILETREAVEGELLEARTEVAASRARRKEMARVITNRETKIAALNAELDARYRELATLERRFLRYSPVWLVRQLARRIGRLVKRSYGRKPISGAKLPA